MKISKFETIFFYQHSSFLFTGYFLLHRNLKWIKKKKREGKKWDGKRSRDGCNNSIHDRRMNNSVLLEFSLRKMCSEKYNFLSRKQMLSLKNEIQIFDSIFVNFKNDYFKVLVKVWCYFGILLIISFITFCITLIPIMSAFFGSYFWDTIVTF